MGGKMPEEQDKSPSRQTEVRVGGESGTGSAISRGGAAFVVVSAGTVDRLFGEGAELTLGAHKALKPPPEHEIYSLIGRVASEWAHIERSLDELIWELADIGPSKGACMTGQQTIFGRCNIIMGLLTLKERSGKGIGNLRNRAKNISDTGSGPGEQRNRIVHDPWFYFDDKYVGQFKAMAPKDKDLKVGIHRVDRRNWKQH
jgi:hypothetical protein